MFEGNDFSTSTLNTPDTRKNLIKTFKKSIIYNMPLAKLLRTKIKMELSKNVSSEELSELDSESLVYIEKIDRKYQAFFKPYIINSQVDLKIPDKQFDRLISDRKFICGIVYIPTKNTIFRLRTSTEERHPTLAAQFKILNNNQIKSIDLTKILRKNKNKNIWWPDDTHWNKNGINLSANSIKDKLKCLN